MHPQSIQKEFWAERRQMSITCSLSYILNFALLLLEDRRYINANEFSKVSTTSGVLYRNPINTLRPRQNGRHFTDDILKCIILNENVWISITISLDVVPGDPINNIPSML